MDIKARKKLLWAILFSIGFLVFLLMRVEWKHFSLIAVRLDIKDLIAACSVFILGNLVRTFRFYHLDHMDNRLTLWWNLNAFYNFITATLPGGAGEAATTYVMKRFSSLNLFSAFRILLLSRLMDLSAISALFLSAALLIDKLTPYREAAILISGIMFLLSLVALLPATELIIAKLIQKLSWNVAFIRKVSERLNDLLETANERRDISSFAITSIQSLLTMIGGIVALHLLLRAFGVDFTPVQSVYCYGVYAVFQIVPIQGIAGIGTQAAWWVLALNAAGYQASDAVALGFVLHGTFYIFIAIIGLSALMVWLVLRKFN
jgi:hypothetical protein